METHLVCVSSSREKNMSRYQVGVSDGEGDGFAVDVHDLGADRGVLLHEALGGRGDDLRGVHVHGLYRDLQLGRGEPLGLRHLSGLGSSSMLAIQTKQETF